MDTALFTSKVTSTRHKLFTAYKSLTPEKVIIVWLLAALAFTLLFSALLVWNNRFLVSIPARGGKVQEGILGTPRFINPVLAISNPDKDLVALVYAGLTKRDAHGNIIFDMASSILESENKLRYDITINPDARFSDGTPVTADDIIYTISLIQNPTIKSPHRLEWEGVTIQRLSETEVSFVLRKPYPLFMNALTIGILPRHIWKDLTADQFSLSDLNIKAIGSGPYIIKEMKTVSGIPKSFTLEENKFYTLGRPYIEELTIVSYPSEKYLIQAFKEGEISRIHGISPTEVGMLGVATSSIHTSLLPRTFTIFFNPNKTESLSDRRVRQALNMAIDKQAIVNEVLKGYGKVTETPFPFDEDQPVSQFNPSKARELLMTTKYFKNASSTIEITLSTANTGDMKKVAQMVKEYWEAAGVRTTLAIYEVADLNQSVIKDRDFQALLFGSITASPSDLYAFWHSSQRTYPGLNISNYVSRRLDTNLETIREGSDDAEREAAYEGVKEEFRDEAPGIFIFAPSLMYVTRDHVTSPLPAYSLDSYSRFDLVSSWYRYTEKVWPKTYYKPVITKLENILH